MGDPSECMEELEARDEWFRLAPGEDKGGECDSLRASDMRRPEASKGGDPVSGYTCAHK